METEKEWGKKRVGWRVVEGTSVISFLPFPGDHVSSCGSADTGTSTESSRAWLTPGAQIRLTLLDLTTLFFVELTISTPGCTRNTTFSTNIWINMYR